MSPPAFGITGWKNSGKTTLTARLIAEFTSRGYRVCAIKHAHESFDIDQPGRDSYRLREAGARRVLLSSIPGAAVVAVKIEGVLHEFSTIPGVVEDVTEVVLNLKRLLVKLHTDKPKVLKLEAKKKGPVTAADLSADRDPGLAKAMELLNSHTP